MVTSISVALCNLIRRSRLLGRATAVLWQPGLRKQDAAYSRGSTRDMLTTM